MKEFFAMGGYAVWVWSSYAVALGALAAVGVRSALRARANRAALAALRARLEREGGPA